MNIKLKCGYIKQCSNSHTEKNFERVLDINTFC
jgi:hypothetical protein